MSSFIKLFLAKANHFELGNASFIEERELLNFIPMDCMQMLLNSFVSPLLIQSRRHCIHCITICGQITKLLRPGVVASVANECDNTFPT